MNKLNDISARLTIDEARLTAWMRDHVAGFEGPVTARRFGGGQSNPTYELIAPARKYVLRRKPMGVLLPSAHAIDREFRVISALSTTNFPVPKPVVLCMDDSVIGSAFYVMQYVEGRLLWDGALPGLQPAERRSIYEELLRTLARLHNIDHETIGLGGYGKPGNYFQRQVDRWSRQYKASETGVIKEMDRLIDWLPATLPAQDRVSIVHGDFRLDNLILDPDKAETRAVLDWELSTLGDPLADFSYLLVNWVAPEGAGAGKSAFGHLDVSELGIPSLEECVAQYCDLTGRESIPNLNWYFAYNLFRLAAIFQGIAGRLRDGTAHAENAQEYADRTATTAKAAWSFARNAEI